MDCSGLRVLAEVQSRFTPNGRLRLARPRGQVERLMRLTGHDVALPFAD